MTNDDLRDLNRRLETRIARSREVIAADRRRRQEPIQFADRRMTAFPSEWEFRGLDVAACDYTEPMFPGLWAAMALPVALAWLGTLAVVLG